jgi:hypothetical protein
MYSCIARRSIGTPIGISFDRHSLFADLTNRSANAFEYFVSRSTIKCRVPRSIPVSASVRLRAICNIHASFGFVVTPAMTTRRVDKLITKRM